MDHTEAQPLLADSVAADFDSARHPGLEEHVESCEECSHWVGTYSLFAELLSGKATRHLSSHELGAFAVDPQILGESLRAGCERHLACCPQCAEELELTRSAVLEARQPPHAWWSAPAESGRSLDWRTGLAMAAALILVIGALLFVGPLTSVPRDARVTEQRLEGERTIETRDSIFVDATELRSGAEVTLRTGSVVAFGDGFAVEAGASLAVVIDGKQDSKPVKEDRAPVAGGEVGALLLAPQSTGA